jgi:hypothetical protein
MTIIKYDEDPFLFGGRVNLGAILVHVLHEPSPITTFITATIPHLNSILP